MCKMCAVKNASIIDNLQADTSLKLANAAAVLFSAARNKEGDELVQAALDYWKAPKDDAAADAVQQSANAGCGQTSNIGQAEAPIPNPGFIQVAVHPDGSYVTQGPVPSQGFHMDRDSGELYSNGKLIGHIIVERTHLGNVVFFKPAR